MRTLSAHIGIFSLFAAACGGSGDAESGEDDLTVTPTGGTSALLVSMGPGTAAATILASKSGGGTIPLSPGVATAVSPGHWCISTQVGSLQTQSDCVDVPSGAQVDYTLGAVQFVRSCSEAILGVDIPMRNVGYNGDPYNVELLVQQTAPIPHAAGAGLRFAYDNAGNEPGSYGTTSIPQLRFVQGAIEENKITEMDLCDGPIRAKILPPPSRALPTHPSSGFIFFNRKESYFSAYTMPMTEWPEPAVVILPDANWSLALRRPDAHYWQPEQEYSLDPLGGVEQTVQLGRIDVTDVEVQNLDGTTTAVKGTFSIQQINETKIPTGHGVDVFPGTYTVKVEYKHPADGSAMVDSYEAVIP